MSALRQVTRDVRVDAPAARVWSAVADAASLAAWLGVDLDVDLRAGAEGTARDREAVKRVVVERMEPPRRLVFRWWAESPPDVPTLVEIRVVPDGDGARVSVRETAVPDLVLAP